MKVETINKGNDLLKQIEDVKKLKHAAINQKTEWIEFTFGNGSNRQAVCADDTHIQQVKDLIISLNTEKIIRLQKEFDNLTD